MHQRIEAEIERLRAPSDFSDPAGGTNQFHGQLEGAGVTGSVNDHIGTQSVALACPSGGITDQTGASIGCFSNGQTVAVVFQPDDGHLGSGQPGDGGTEDTDGTGTENDDAVPRFKAGIFNDRIVRHAARFSEASQLQRQRIGHPVQTTRWHPHPARHSTIHPVAKPFAGRIKIVQATTGHRIVPRNDGRRFADNPITFVPGLDVFSKFRNNATKFMPEHDRIVHWP